MTENNSIPESTPITTPVADSPAIATRADDSTDARKRSRTRTLLIAGGSVLAAAVLAGGGIAVGAAIADDMGDDDRDSSSTSDDSTSDDNADDGADDGDGDGADQSADDEAAAGLDVGSDSADELNDIISVASASASAEGEAVALEANRDGSWDVTFETSGGEESDVRVTADGNAEVVSTDAADADDSAPLGALDAATVDALVAAALAEADGRITDIELDDDTASPYDISVVTADGRSVELDLDADMKVLSTNGS